MMNKIFEIIEHVQHARNTFKKRKRTIRFSVAFLAIIATPLGQDQCTFQVQFILHSHKSKGIVIFLLMIYFARYRTF